jgi:hypothetical protein
MKFKDEYGEQTHHERHHPGDQPDARPRSRLAAHR